MYFLNINKPKNITSFDVIRVLRKKLNIKQIGHSGTLDPLAVGVMQVAVGKATKLLDYLDSDKTYIASIKFGYRTETFDSEGDEIFVQNPDFTLNELKDILEQFIGKTGQIPPKYSAVKIKGKKLCDIARKKPEAEIKILPREIEIYSIKLLNFDSISYTAKIEVKCKKGTYIRSLVNDIGERLSCGAYLTDLIRTEAGNFSIENSDDLNNEKYNQINPIDVLNIEKYEISEDEYKKIKNGIKIPAKNESKNNLLLLTKNNKLIALAKCELGIIKSEKYFGE